jgi:hypothetical protein
MRHAARPTPTPPRLPSHGHRAAVPHRRDRPTSYPETVYATPRPAPGCHQIPAPEARAATPNYLVPDLANPRPGSMISFAGSTPAARRRRRSRAARREPQPPRRGRAVPDADGRPIPSANASTPTARRPRRADRHGLVGASTGHVVHHLRAVLQRRPRHTGVHRVDADCNALCTASPLTTGTTRAVSTRGSTRTAPGRVDSPPTSTIDAPSATNAKPCSTARSASR